MLSAFPRCGAPSKHPRGYETDAYAQNIIDHPCEWRVRTVQALDRVGRRWRTAFESGSLTAIQAAVRAGMGVATLLPWNVENGMALLDAEANRLPPAPSVKLALYRRSGLRNDPVTDMLERLLWNTVL
jgi:DNA-binding transcriptional LysR family regulator